jgi:hypothetical protein
MVVMMAKPGYAARNGMGATREGRSDGFLLDSPVLPRLASTMLRRLLPAALALAGALSLSSCLDYDEELTIHRDLSGEARVTITLPDAILGKYESAASEMDKAKIEKRLESVSGVTLASYEKSEGRQPKVKLLIRFTSLEKLNDAIAANPPAAIYAGKFSILKQGGVITIDRKLGVGKVEGSLPESNSAFYKTHFDGEIKATNSTRYDSASGDVRYSYQLSEILARQPTQSVTVAKSWPWLLILGCLAAIGGAGWFGWEQFGKRKQAASRMVPPPPGPASVPDGTPGPGRPGPRRPGPPPKQ